MTIMVGLETNTQLASVTPILVVGLNRSGTKWLSNILCNHSNVAGIQSERARGILETNMFHRMQAKFDLRSADDYVGFIELWSRTEFFQYIGEDIDFLYGLNPRPLSFITLFGLVMQRYAERSGATHWLQKCDPERALVVIPKLGNPKVVIIKRDTIAVAESLRQMNRNRGHQFSLLKSIPAIARAEKLLLRVEKRARVVAVTYENLLKDPVSTTESVCEQLGLDFSESLLDVRFRRNTSFQNARPAPISPVYEHFLRLTAACSSMLPLGFLDWALRIREFDRRPVRFVQGTFGGLKDRLSDRRDYYL